jgi:hypothetical protein
VDPEAVSWGLDFTESDTQAQSNSAIIAPRPFSEEGESVINTKKMFAFIHTIAPCLPLSISSHGVRETFVYCDTRSHETQGTHILAYHFTPVNVSHQLAFRRKYSIIQPIVCGAIF